MAPFQRPSHRGGNECKVRARRPLYGLVTSSMGRRAGFRGSLVGIVVGGLSWIVMAGLIIRDILLWAPASALGAGLIWLAMWAYARRPERAIAILGGTALGVAAICALYPQPVWDRIPDQWGGTAGKPGLLPSELLGFLGLTAAGSAALGGPGL